MAQAVCLFAIEAAALQRHSVLRRQQRVAISVRICIVCSPDIRFLHGQSMGNILDACLVICFVARGILFAVRNSTATYIALHFDALLFFFILGGVFLEFRDMYIWMGFRIAGFFRFSPGSSPSV
jgi:hypothetical protein